MVRAAPAEVAADSRPSGARRAPSARFHAPGSGDVRLAQALRARTLVFLSDIPGVLKGGRVIEKLAPADALAEIAGGTITGGMVAKVRACLGALEGGVDSIIIGEYTGRGSVAALLGGERGTRIARK